MVTKIFVFLISSFTKVQGKIRFAVKKKKSKIITYENKIAKGACHIDGSVSMYRCSNTDKDYGIFSSSDVPGVCVQTHTHTFSNMPLCHSFGKRRLKDIKREK